MFGSACLCAGWGGALVSAGRGPEGLRLAAGLVLVALVGGALRWAFRRDDLTVAERRELEVARTLRGQSSRAMIVTDASGLVEDFNSGAEKLLGYRSREVTGRLRFERFLQPAELQRHANLLAAELGRPVPADFSALAAGAATARGAAEFAWTFVRGDGGTVPVRLVLAPIRTDAGALAGYLAIATDASAERRAEQRGRDAEARLRKISGHVPGLLFQFQQRPDGTAGFPFVSEGILALGGVEPAAVRDDAGVFLERVLPDDRALLHDSLAESARTLARWSCEFRIRAADGAVRWLRAAALPERADDGATSWHGCMTDFTERKAMERAHEESRVLLHSVFATVDLGMFVVDVGGPEEFSFVEINPAYERLTGLVTAEVRGRSPREMVPAMPAEMAECLCANFRRGAEATGPIDYEEPFFIHGRLLWWHTTLAPVRDAAGRTVRLVGRSQDITERKLIELRFQSLNERLQLATEAAQLGIWDYDLVKNRIVWDARMHALYGCGPAEFDGSMRHWLERIHPDDLARVVQAQRAATEGGQPYSTTFRIRRADGEEREVRACAYAQRNAAGRAVRLVGVNWDVTAERQARADIERARDEAEKLNRQLGEALDRANSLAREAAAATVAKTEFLANMSHEIRTPLNAVIGMSGLLLDTGLNRDQRELAETIRTSGDGLLGLINDILDYSKIESGRLELEDRAFDLRTCVENSLDVLAARAAEKGLDLVCAFDAGLPERVCGDETRLRQIVLNLLSNAIKFTARGEVFVSVSAVAPAGPRVRLRLAVHDSGIGIPPDRIDRLFKTFSQVDATTTRQYGGTGLGLAICKRLAELMGGRIWVESTPGKGSSFHFEIEAGPAPEAGPPKPYAAGRVPALAGRRVLVVDDNATGCRVLCQQGVTWGLVPRAAGTAAAALAILDQDAAIDTVIVDRDLPETPGAALAAELGARYPGRKVAVIVLTPPASAGNGPLPGVFGVLSKPVKAGALFALLTERYGGEAPAAPVAAAAAALPGLAHPLAILLAEDNPVNQRVAALMLQRLGYRAEVAANGREAVEAVARKIYDLVLMDLQMPEMDGLQATREIRARHGDADRPRIVAMTANASLSDRERCLEAGMDDFMTKPVRGADLQKVLAETPARAGAAAPR
ncbi:MAG: hypothetical protein B9S34_02330 [Opitutia bacterium Tous-C1TDCM]|nr:MAG: hypothetical protein B9S34_02330 [Opitutae bacterium Tous-C1TDCM]